MDFNPLPFGNVFRALQLSPVGAAGLAGLILIWLILAAVLVLKGEDVDRPNRIVQLYGYSVCVIMLVVSVFSFASLVNAAIDRANPLQADFNYGAALTSFEAYQATYRREMPFVGPNAAAQPDTVSETTLRQRYDALVRDRISLALYRTSKAMVNNALLMIVALILFFAHWRWMRRVTANEAAA